MKEIKDIRNYPRKKKREAR